MAGDLVSVLAQLRKTVFDKTASENVMVTRLVSPAFSALPDRVTVDEANTVSTV